MSATNHIIIPIVDTRQNIEDQKVFTPTYSLLTPSKRSDFKDLPFWKRSASAFKKFKQKKDRREKWRESCNENSDLFGEVKQRKRLKLVPREIRTLTLITQNRVGNTITYEYFDPNEAPLLQSLPLEKDDPLSKSTDHNPTPHKDQEPLQYISQQKMDLQIKDSPRMEIEPRDDDPFIIVRKETCKKSGRNGGKSKQIRKEKTKGKSSDQMQERERNILNRISKVMDSQEAIVPLLKSKTSHSADRKESPSSHSLSSPEQNPIPSQKQLFNEYKQTHCKFIQ